MKSCSLACLGTASGAGAAAAVWMLEGVIGGCCCAGGGNDIVGAAAAAHLRNPSKKKVNVQSAQTPRRKILNSA